ncbi:2Fe-2S iron-sulfur cluster-binding protein [Pseudomonas sp. nanlin1]|uniref:2Fe-2S iron-sulfur cluster-binding protein n=1 Tax=Pseudomonas sp. nanlin1 TaxID=3040605 RepID=UPI00388E8DE6
MACHKLSIACRELEFLLPEKARMTDIEYEPDGQGVIPFGCRSGACGTCVIKVLAGAEQLDAMGNDEKDFIEMLGYCSASHRLACQTRLHGAVTIAAAEQASLYTPSSQTPCSLEPKGVKP